jgi:hypothetical protein
MKKLNIFLILLLVSLSTLTSCNYLDTDDYFIDEIQIDSVFANKRNIEAYLWAIPDAFGDQGALYEYNYTPGPLATDECFTMFKTLTYGYYGMSYVLGEINASNLYDLKDYYSQDYQAIRKCNQLLANITKPYDLTATQRLVDYSYTKFFRAYAYYRILVDFGPPILLGDEVISSNASLKDYDRPRATYDEAVDYICNEFEEAAKGLPKTVSIMNFGRPTQGAAYGLIARLRLYQASPAFNGGSAAKRYFGNWKRTSDKADYVNQTYDEKRWAVAAAACKRVMDMQNAGQQLYSLHVVDADGDTPALPTGITSDPDYYSKWPAGAAGIDPYRSYSEMFNGESVLATNPEWVWARRSATLVANTEMAFPTKYSGWNSLCIPQKIVDNYRMFDGRQIDNSSEAYPYSETGFTTRQISFSGYRLNSGVYNMYANREMRFYASVGFSECFWPMTSTTSSGLSNRTITYYYDSPNGKQNTTTDFTATGYVLKKYIHPSDAWTGDNARRMDKAYPIIRYADILLMYAEALNNLTQSYTVQIGDEQMTVSRDVEAIRSAFNQVRHRAGLPGVSTEELADPTTMQKLIEQERMIELLNENARYYDVRRWGIYEDVESVPITGMNADSGKDGFYTRVIPNTSRIGSRLVNKKLVFLPLPLDEVRKLPSLDQNPGWEK